MKWVMTEHKVIQVDEKRGTAMGGLPVVIPVMRAFHPGDEAPAGHEGRPYTRQVPDEEPEAGARIESGEGAQDRMDRGAGAIRRGRKPRKE